jgi:AcrR family transcriptional regulator
LNGEASGAARPVGARERILDAAQRLFARRGFDVTPTKAIAQEAGVPGSLIFYYFPSKEALLECIIDERDILPEIREALEVSVEADPRSTLIDFGVRFLKTLKEHEELVCILLREFHSNEKVAARFKELREERYELVASYLDESVRAGRLKPVNVHMLARLFVSGMVFAAVIEEPPDPEHFVEEAVDVLLHGLLPGEE